MSNLKTFSLMLMLILSSCLISCSDSDEPQNDALIGTWTYVVTDNSWSGKNEVGISYTFTKQNKAICKMWVYKNGRKTMDDEFNFSYSFNGTTLTLKDSSGDTTSYVISINGNKMVMDGRTYTKQ